MFRRGGGACPRLNDGKHWHPLGPARRLRGGMNEFELSYRMPDGLVTRIVVARDAEAAELMAPLEAEDLIVRPLPRRGPVCQRNTPANWPIRR